MANLNPTQPSERALPVADSLEKFMSELMDVIAMLHVARSTFEAALDVDANETLCCIRSVLWQGEQRLDELHNRIDKLSVSLAAVARATKAAA